MEEFTFQKAIDTEGGKTNREDWLMQELGRGHYAQTVYLNFEKNRRLRERSTAEVDFLIQHSGHFIPIEVKAEENLHSKSLKVFREKYDPPISLRLSMSDYRTQDRLINIPLYAISRLNSVIKFPPPNPTP